MAIPRKITAKSKCEAILTPAIIAHGTDKAAQRDTKIRFQCRLIYI